MLREALVPQEGSNSERREVMFGFNRTFMGGNGRWSTTVPDLHYALSSGCQTLHANSPLERPSLCTLLKH